MATNAFTMRIDSAPVERMASRVASIADRALTRISAASAANDVARRFQKTAQREMNRGINLTDDYVASKMAVTPATPVGSGKVRAEIVTRGDLTIIGHFPFEQLRGAGTPTRSGDSRGRRPSGVRVEIKRGQAVTEPQWFTMRLRAGTASGDKTGLFVRTSEGRVKHLYGPSPYSLFRYQINALNDDLSADLATTAASVLANNVERALS